MKLIFCTSCWDVVKLAAHEERACTCGQCRGRYEEDQLNAWYSGETAVPLGFNNFSLASAVQGQPETGMGKMFEAFVIPKECPTFRKKP